MRIEGKTNGWAIGDCALPINAFDNKPSPPTGQFAERQGRQAALNLIRIVNGEATKSFHFKALGQLCSIGGYHARRGKLRGDVSGFLAPPMWGAVYLFTLPPLWRTIKISPDPSADQPFPLRLTLL